MLHLPVNNDCFPGHGVRKDYARRTANHRRLLYGVISQKLSVISLYVKYDTTR